MGGFVSGIALHAKPLRMQDGLQAPAAIAASGGGEGGAQVVLVGQTLAGSPLRERAA